MSEWDFGSYSYRIGNGDGWICGEGDTDTDTGTDTVSDSIDVEWEGSRRS